MSSKHSPFALLLVVAMLGGCGARHQASGAPPAGDRFAARLLAGEGLSLWLAERRGGRGDSAVVYVEGDGRAWRTRHRVSADPTPREPVALRLAEADPGPRVLYLARPCQFLSRALRRRCDPRYWTGDRYAPEVLAAMEAGVRAYLSRHPEVRHLGLVGYSGGGLVAAWLAARLPESAWLVTLAADLDPVAWSRHHGIDPPRAAPDAAALGRALRGLPQLHLYGGRDPVVPRSTAHRFLAALGEGATVEVVEGLDHRCCWAQAWPGRVCALAPEGPWAAGWCGP